jgi:putative phosphoesterase
MRLAVLSDVHGNLPALEAVLADMPPVESVVFLGDVIGYNPWPQECIQRIWEVADIVLQGNHDRLVDTPEALRGNEMAYEGLRYARSQLTEEEKQWLTSLPEQGEVDGFLLVHSHPGEQDAYVLPRMFPRMRPYLNEHKGILLGHTHIQHEAVIDGRLILNPGSVGQPRDGDGRAAYALVDTESLDTEFRRVEYDHWVVVRAVEEAGLPVETSERLAEGR